LNMDKLYEALDHGGFTYHVVSPAFMASSSQCDIFHLFAQAGAVIGPYGSDLTYPMLLKKPIFTLMSKYSTENFYEVMKGQLLYDNAFRVIYADAVIGKDAALDRRLISGVFEEWRIGNFLEHDMRLTAENTDDLVTLVTACLGQHSKQEPLADQRPTGL